MGAIKPVLAASAALLLASCAAVYQHPGPGEPAAHVIEQAKRKGAAWYEAVAVSEIDGQPVPPRAGGLGTEALRVAPGLRHLVVTVSYRHGGGDDIDCPCRASFPLALELAAGQRLRLDARIAARGQVTLKPLDAVTGQPLAPEQTAQARTLPKDVYLPMGGGWLQIPSGGAPSRP